MTILPAAATESMPRERSGWTGLPTGSMAVQGPVPTFRMISARPSERRAPTAMRTWLPETEVEAIERSRAVPTGIVSGVQVVAWLSEVRTRPSPAVVAPTATKVPVPTEVTPKRSPVTPDSRGMKTGMLSVAVREATIWALR